MSHKYKNHKLVSDLPNNGDYQDVHTKNSWGIIMNDCNMVISQNASNVLAEYNLNGKAVNITSGNTGTNTIAVDGGVPSGIVANNSDYFLIAKTSTFSKPVPSDILIATSNGKIAGYNKSVDATNAVITYDNSSNGSVYTGIAQAGNYIYVTDFYNAKVDVYDQNFNPVTLSGTAFVDASLPAIVLGTVVPESVPGYAPFNIAHICDHLYVSYAFQNVAQTDIQAGAGLGYISVFNLDGTFVKRLVNGAQLNGPWGMTIAPKCFGAFSRALLVGNMGDGKINAYKPDGSFIGTVSDNMNTPIVIDGLRALKSHNKYVYYTSGPNGQVNGLVGRISMIHKR